MVNLLMDKYNKNGEMMEEEISLKDYVEIFRNNLLLITSCILFALLIGCILCFSLKRIYKSSAVLYIQRKEQVDIFESKTKPFIDEKTLSDYISFITSYKVVKKAAEKLYLYDENMVNKLINCIKIKNKEKVFWEVEFYSDISPEDALKKLNALIESFIEFIFELTKERVSFATQIYKTQLEELRKEMEETEKEIRDFKQNEKIIVLKEQQKKNIEEIAYLENIKSNIEIEIKEKMAKLESIKKKLNEIGIDIHTDDVKSLRLKSLALPAFEKELIEQMIKIDVEMSPLLEKKNEIEQKLNLHYLTLKTLPEKEYKLLNLERKYALQEAAYKSLNEAYLNTMAKSISESPEVEIKIIQPPIMRKKSVSPHKKVVMLISLICGLTLGLITTALKLLFQQPYISIEEIKKCNKLPILGKIPKIKKLNKNVRIDKMQIDPYIDEHLKKLAFNLLHLYSSDNQIVLGISSVTPKEGKSVLSSLLGLTFAKQSKRTIIIDFDTHKYAISRLFGLPFKETMEMKSIIENLAIVSSTKDYSNIKALWETIKQNYQVVICDVPPLTLSTTIHLKELINDILLIVNLFHSPKPLVEETIQNNEFNIIGIVVNKLNTIDYYYSYYRYYHHYYTKGE